MGYIRHHAIVVTSHGDHAFNAHRKAVLIFGHLVSNIIDSEFNGYMSFFIAPDGSKEGWSDSDDYDSKRNEFISWIKSNVYEDGSNSISYAMLYYGDDNGEAKIEDYN